jgi:hypothetical protein
MPQGVRMLGLELVVALGGAILVSGLAGRRLNVAPPVFLLLAGVLIGLIPQLRHVELPPEVVLLLFLEQCSRPVDQPREARGGRTFPIDPVMVTE